MKWSERKPSGSTGEYGTLSTSYDGKTMVAGYRGGRLYLSTNYGVSWSEIRPAGNVNKYWGCSAIDSDGSNIVVGVNGGRLYTSDDGGASWTERRPDGDSNNYWDCVASDNNGSHLYASYGSFTFSTASLFVSTNYGVSWTNITPVSSTSSYLRIFKICTDSDGSFVSCCGHTLALGGGTANDVLLTSTNAGSSWTERKPNGVLTSGYSWNSVDCAGTGSHMVVCGDAGLFKSTNSGSSWTKIGTLVYQDAQISADGVYYSIVRSDGVRLSRNGGVDFTLENPAGSGTLDWRRISQSKYGSHIICGWRGPDLTGSLYTGSVFPFVQII